MTMISEAIRKAHAAGIKIGICGQGPSNHPEFAAFLVREGIDSISLNPDSYLKTVPRIAEAEKASARTQAARTEAAGTESAPAPAGTESAP
jgi:pyruvate,water dikinase